MLQFANMFLEMYLLTLWSEFYLVTAKYMYLSIASYNFTSASPVLLSFTSHLNFSNTYLTKPQQKNSLSGKYQVFIPISRLMLLFLYCTGTFPLLTWVTLLLQYQLHVWKNMWMDILFFCILVIAFVLYFLK